MLFFLRKTIVIRLNSTLKGLTQYVKPPNYEFTRQHGIYLFMWNLLFHSTLMMFEHHANLKYKFGNRHFWAEGYYVSTVGLNEEAIRKYIKEQEKHDMAMDRLSVKEYEDPFK